eukprot:6548606-Prymnesium_polylepis.1
MQGPCNPRAKDILPDAIARLLALLTYTLNAVGRRPTRIPNSVLEMPTKAPTSPPAVSSICAAQRNPPCRSRSAATEGRFCDATPTSHRAAGTSAAALKPLLDERPSARVLQILCGREHAVPRTTGGPDTFTPSPAPGDVAPNRSPA